MTVQSSPHTSLGLWLRTEHVVLLALAVAAYAQLSSDWLLFATLFFVPDVSMLGYLRDARIGSIVYNAGHLLSIAIAVIAVGVFADSLALVQIGLIWSAHIAFDRVMGYGLKYPTQFKDTHLQRV